MRATLRLGRAFVIAFEVHVVWLLARAAVVFAQLRAFSVARMAGGVALAAAAAACNVDRSPAPSGTSASPPWSASALADDEHATLPVGCGTLREGAESDVVRLVGSTLLYADEGTGLSAWDVEDVDHPRRLGASAFVGTPLAVLVDAPARVDAGGREGTAWVVFVDWDARTHASSGPTHPAAGPSTVVRAVDLGGTELHGLGEIAAPGVATSAKLVAGVLHVLRDGEPSVLASYGLRAGALVPLGELPLAGRARWMAASPAGLAVVAAAGDEGRSEALVHWVDLPLEAPSRPRLRSTMHVAGGVSAWRADLGGEGQTVWAGEDQDVRLVACETHACATSERATVHALTFARGEPRLLASTPITRAGGMPVTRFAGDDLYVAEPRPRPRGAAPATELRVLRLPRAGAPVFVGAVRLRGAVASIVARPDHEGVLAIASVGAPSSSVRIAVHDVDTRAVPTLRGTVTFGGTRTWSVAEDRAAAVAFDPGGRFIVLPFTAWTDAERRYEAGSQVVRLGRGHGEEASRASLAGPAIVSEIAVERAIFVNGRLVTLGSDGLQVFDTSDARRPRLIERSDELGAVR